LSVTEGDALQVDCARLGQSPRRIVANLPYNIATPLIIKWLQAGGAFKSITVMVQREVADRLAAKPRTKDYGRLSVLAQFLSRPKRLFDVPPRAFIPPPKVTSSVIELIPLAEPAASARIEDLERITQAAFGQRRKMLRQSLRSLGLEVEPLLKAAEIDPTARAEELSVAQFAGLARAFRARREPHA
jgi:16S rRNA (adenine1518-N6/adenine1519-N6)-dimethyltransferase